MLDTLQLHVNHHMLKPLGIDPPLPEPFPFPPPPPPARHETHVFWGIIVLSHRDTPFLTHFGKIYENLCNSHISGTRRAPEKYNLSKCMYEMQGTQFCHTLWCNSIGFLLILLGDFGFENMILIGDFEKI